mmetsp:Transcript_32817/g.57253  ORF Transcript_32817/g.57253 Transcript_32817/m.57253 type:complete len:80 (+) Transcript_32817:1808-2047(+)
MLERIEGIIKGTFKGGGYIEQADGQLFIYYESHLKDPEPEVLVRNSRVVALITGVTVVEIRRKEHRMTWSEALLSGLTI